MKKLIKKLLLLLFLFQLNIAITYNLNKITAKLSTYQQKTTVSSLLNKTANIYKQNTSVMPGGNYTNSCTNCTCNSNLNLLACSNCGSNNQPSSLSYPGICSTDQQITYLFNNLTPTSGYLHEYLALMNEIFQNSSYEANQVGAKIYSDQLNTLQKFLFPSLASFNPSSNPSTKQLTINSAGSLQPVTILGSVNLNVLGLTNQELGDDIVAISIQNYVLPPQDEGLDTQTLNLDPNLPAAPQIAAAIAKWQKSGNFPLINGQIYYSNQMACQKSRSGSTYNAATGSCTCGSGMTYTPPTFSNSISPTLGSLSPVPGVCSYPTIQSACSFLSGNFSNGSCLCPQNCLYTPPTIGFPGSQAGTCSEQTGQCTYSAQGACLQAGGTYNGTTCTCPGSSVYVAPSSFPSTTAGNCPVTSAPVTSSVPLLNIPNCTAAGGSPNNNNCVCPNGQTYSVSQMPTITEATCQWTIQTACAHFGGTLTNGSCACTTCTPAGSTCSYTSPIANWGTSNPNATSATPGSCSVSSGSGLN